MRVNEDGLNVYMLWMKAKSIPKYPPAYQKVWTCRCTPICGQWYFSVHLVLCLRPLVVSRTLITRFPLSGCFCSVQSAARQIGYRFGENGPKGLKMLQSLDHSLYFYNHDFNMSDWMLYVIICPRAEAGRGFVHGRIYDRKGVLCAIAGQEGLIRTNDMISDHSSDKSKLWR